MAEPGAPSWVWFTSTGVEIENSDLREVIWARRQQTRKGSFAGPEDAPASIDCAREWSTAETANWDGVK
jgi:hypothetical protein